MRHLASLSKSTLRLQKGCKRVFDILIALLVLGLTWPLLLLAMLAIRISMGGPVFFVQQRPGLRGRPFHVYKLRTMTDLRDGGGNLLPPEQRLTRLGRLIRNSSMDEIPQLLNVIRGEMSLVGPRPLLMEYLERYTPEQARRHEILPGITGWSQVHGRNSINWEERFRQDVWYVDHWSLWLDIKILVLTVLKVLSREGVNFSNNSVSSPYLGKRDNGESK